MVTVNVRLNMSPLLRAPPSQGGCVLRVLGYSCIAFFHELPTRSWLKIGFRLSNPLIFVADIWCI
jgi:hypothetical protein